MARRDSQDGSYVLTYYDGAWQSRRITLPFCLPAGKETKKHHTLDHGGKKVDKTRTYLRDVLGIPLSPTGTFWVVRQEEWF